MGSIESQYESITVEAPQAAADSLWTGYAADPGSGVTAVGASWIEPTVSGPNGSKLSTWVGIDGWGGSTVEQCGVAATVVNGVAQYVAWYEFFGDQTPSNVSPNPNPKGPDYGQQNISTVTFPVYAGDQISASVSLVPGTTREFLFQMTDQSIKGGNPEIFSRDQAMQYVTPALSTAEWIDENPNYAAQPLANFGGMRFTGAWATVSSTTTDINQLKSLYSLVIGSGLVDDTSVSNPPDIDYGVGDDEPSSATWSSSFFVDYNESTTGDVVIGSKSAPATLSHNFGMGVVATQTDEPAGSRKPWAPWARAPAPSTTPGPSTRLLRIRPPGLDSPSARATPHFGMIRSHCVCFCLLGVRGALT